MLRPDINAIGAKWIAAFRLQGLRIAFGYVRNLVHPMTGMPVYALMSELNRDEGSYRIEIQDPDTWPKDAPRPPTQKTIENAFRHEALHIRVRDFAKSNPSEADIVAEERAVWAISDAFDYIADNAIQGVAAMVMPLLQQGPKNFSKAAAIVRAMAVQPAATRRQTKGASMDILDILLAAIEAAMTAEDPKAALAELLAKVRGLKEKGGSVAPESDAMPQGAGEMDPEKDKMQMGGDPKMAQALAGEYKQARAMVAEITTLRDEVKTAVAILRPQAKVEIVRAMRAEGLALTPAAEKQILDAPTVEVANERAAGMRAMGTGATPRANARPATGDAAGLTRAQLAEYERIARTNPNRAAMFAAQCVKGGDQ